MSREIYVQSRTSDGRVYISSIRSNDAGMDYDIRDNRRIVSAGRREIPLSPNVQSIINPAKGSLGY